MTVINQVKWSLCERGKVAKSLACCNWGYLIWGGGIDCWVGRIFVVEFGNHIGSYVIIIEVTGIEYGGQVTLLC